MRTGPESAVVVVGEEVSAGPMAAVSVRVMGFCAVVAERVVDAGSIEVMVVVGAGALLEDDKGSTVGEEGAAIADGDEEAAIAELAGCSLAGFVFSLLVVVVV